MAIPPPPEGSQAEQIAVSNGNPQIELVRVYNAVSPFNFLFEFRPTAIENWRESVEGDTGVDLIIDERTSAKLAALYDGSYSLIVSLVSDMSIYRVTDRHVTTYGFGWSSYVYDSYYVQTVRQVESTRSYRLTCVGLKEYLNHRLAIPASRNTIDGTVSVPDGSQESKPIPSNQILSFTNKSYKGILAGLFDETNLLQQLPLGRTNNDISGTRQRTYLLKDMRSIKEAIDNILDDQDSPDIVFDGSFGDRNSVSFFFAEMASFERGMRVTQLNDRNSEIFRPTVELSQANTVNNLWTVGNAADGNILLAHKVQANTSGKILLQSANTERNDIQTPLFLLDYTMGILQRSGQTIRTMALTSGLTAKMFVAFAGNSIYMQTPDHPEINNSFWYITARRINTATKQIEFDLVEQIINN